MDEYGERLYPNSEIVSSVPDTWESQSSSTYRVKQFVISVVFYSMRNRYNRRIRPNASNEHKYIVVAIDYFSRWIKVESFGTLKAKQMAKFIEKNLICRYGVPHHIMTDNGVQFQAETAELL